MAKVAESVKGKSAVAAKKSAEVETKKAAKPAKPEMWGTKQMAEELGVDPKKLRMILRKNGKGLEGSEEGRYQWTPDDPKAIASVKKLVDAYDSAAEERREKAAEAKETEAKAAKKNGKPAKKAAKKTQPEEEEAEEEVEESGDEEVFEEEEEE